MNIQWNCRSWSEKKGVEWLVDRRIKMCEKFIGYFNEKPQPSGPD